MSKWFEVKVVTVKVLAVEVEDDEDRSEAIMYGIGEVGDFDEVDCNGPIIDPVVLDSIKRHADEVLSL